MRKYEKNPWHVIDAIYAPKSSRFDQIQEYNDLIHSTHVCGFVNVFFSVNKFIYCNVKLKCIKRTRERDKIHAKKMNYLSID